MSMEELAPPSRKNTKPVVILWRGSHHAYHDCLRAAIAELAASGGLSRHWLGAPGGPVFFLHDMDCCDELSEHANCCVASIADD